MATIRYLVRDVDEALPFYEALGFEVSERWGPRCGWGGRGFLRGWRWGRGWSAATPLPGGRTPEPGGWNRLVIEVQSLETAMRDLQAYGIRFRSEPVQGPGGRQVLVEDPSGNPVELFEAAGG